MLPACVCVRCKEAGLTGCNKGQTRHNLYAGRGECVGEWVGIKLRPACPPEPVGLSQSPSSLFGCPHASMRTGVEEQCGRRY
jgi:hypothetical protein